MDSRSGLHDLGGLALSPISHLNVIFGLNSPQSWRGTELVVRFLGRVRLEGNLSQQPCALVLAMAPAPGADRDQTTDDFLTQSYEVFSNSFYDEEGSDGEWPLPQLQDQDQPHFPIVVGFDPMVQRYQSVSDIADRLTEGDFRIFVEKVLARLGRTLT
jgi:hypothetical protein